MTPRDLIAAQLMLKNENRYVLHEYGTRPKYTMLEQVLRRLQSMVSEVYIIDNGSTDGSQEVYEKYKPFVAYVKHNSPNMPFDDLRDKEKLMNVTKERCKKWMLMVDGDEIYEDAATEWIHDLILGHEEDNNELNIAVTFEYINFWRSRIRYRTDKWSGGRFQRLFTTRHLRMQGGPLHNLFFQYERGRTRLIMSDIKVLHYGWADWNHRLAKTERYTLRDMELNRCSYEDAAERYKADVDERGLTLTYADPRWASEFRTGEIDY